MLNANLKKKANSDDLNSVKTSLSDFTRLEPVSKTGVSCPANGLVGIDFTPPVKSGFKLVGIVGGGCTSSSVLVPSFIGSNTDRINFRNMNSTQVTNQTVQAIFLYVRNVS